MSRLSLGRKLILPILVVLVALMVPLAAFADSKAPLNCAVTLGVTNPGSLSFQGSGPQVHTKGEQTAGTVDCNVDLMDGAISTVHNSEIKMDPTTGNFKGQLQGTFTVANPGGVVKGNLEASITGTVIGFVLGPDGAPHPIYSVTDTGKWQLTGGGQGLKGEGSLSITLVGIVGIPAAWGGLASAAPGSLQGEVKVKD